MKRYCWIAVASNVKCTGSGDHGRGNLIGQDSFSLTSSYQHQGEYLQLNYGSAAAGCRFPARLPSRSESKRGRLDIIRQQMHQSKALTELVQEATVAPMLMAASPCAGPDLPITNERHLC